MGRILPVVALVVLVTLAGCSYDTTILVYPEVEDVASVNGDGYELEVTVDPDVESADATVSDVRLAGYSLHGEQTCSESFGDLSSPETATMRCESFPSLLLVQTPDRGKRVEGDDGLLSNRPDFTVETGALLYSGYSGSHQFSQVDVENRGNRGTLTSDGRLVPTDEMYQTLQCYQWKDQRDGNDFSALDSTPWLDWEQRSPDRSRHYEVSISNYTRRGELNQSSIFDTEFDGPPYNESAVPPLLKSEIRSRDGDWGRTLNRTEFYSLVHSFAETDVNSTAGFESAARAMRGEYGSYDNTGINCRANPPRYYQNSGGINNDRGQYVHTSVVVDGSTYQIQLATGQEFSGRAFENVTAP